MERFSCQRCGICCTNIGGRFSDSEIRRIEKGFRELEKLGIYLAISPKDFSIPLFPEEVKTLLRLSKELKIDFHPLPKLFLVDSKSKSCIVVEWDLGAGSCPFYDIEKGCLVYENRPLACRSFPVILGLDGYELLKLCPQTRCLDLSSEEIEKIFVEEVTYAKEFLKRVEENKERIMNLIRMGEISPLLVDRKNALNFLSKYKSKLIQLLNYSFED